MEATGKFMFVECDGQVIVRYYHEDADRYVKVWVAKEVQVLNKKLLIADDRYYYDHQGELSFLGTRNQMKSILGSENDRAPWLAVLDVTGTPLPFKYLMRLHEYYYITIMGYECDDDGVKVLLPDGTRRFYHLELYDDGCSCEGSWRLVSTEE